MAIDSSIYFRQKTPNFTGAIEQGMRLSDIAQQRKEQQGIKEAFKSSMVTGPDGKVSFDQNKAFSALANVSPEKAFQVKQQFNQMDQAALKAKRENLAYQSDLVGRAFAGVKDDQTWKAAIQSLQAQGVDLGQIANEPYDPNLVNNLRMRALNAKEQLSFEQQQKQNDRTYDLQKQELDAKRAESRAKKSESLSKAAMDLRKERSGLPTTKDTQKVSAAFNKVQNASTSGTPAGDLSMIFNYMKMLDPGSVVREGEFATAQNTTGVPGRVVNLYNNLLEGNRLNAEQRQEFLNEAKGVYSAQIDQQRKVDKNFVSLAQKAGLDPQDVILNFEANAPKVKKELENLTDAEIDKMVEDYGGM